MKKTVKRSFVLDVQTLDTLEKLALKQGINTSELVRKFIDKGLSVEGHKQDIDLITDIIRQELTAIYNPVDIKNIVDTGVNRLAKMLMKSGKLSSAEFFLMLKVLMYVWNENDGKDFQQMLKESVALGVDYMQKKDFQINEFLEDTDGLVSSAKSL